MVVASETRSSPEQVSVYSQTATVPPDPLGDHRTPDPRVATRSAGRRPAGAKPTFPSLRRICPPRGGSRWPLVLHSVLYGGSGLISEVERFSVNPTRSLDPLNQTLKQ